MADKKLCPMKKEVVKTLAYQHTPETTKSHFGECDGEACAWNYDGSCAVQYLVFLRKEVQNYE